jgi:hypothetical protein
MNDEIKARLSHALEHAERRGSALESHVSVLKSDVRALLADGGKGDARRTAEYWKAEHIAGNAEIERLRALLADGGKGEAQPVAKIDADGDFVWLVHNPKFAEGTEFYASPTPERADAEKDAARLDALKKIAAIENKMVGSDWEEIEEARSIANAAILAAKEKKS